MKRKKKHKKLETKNDLSMLFFVSRLIEEPTQIKFVCPNILTEIQSNLFCFLQFLFLLVTMMTFCRLHSSSIFFQSIFLLEIIQMFILTNQNCFLCYYHSEILRNIFNLKLKSLITTLMYGNDVIVVHFKYYKKKPKFIPIIEPNIETAKSRSSRSNEFLQKSDKPI